MTGTSIVRWCAALLLAVVGLTGCRAEEAPRTDIRELAAKSGRLPVSVGRRAGRRPGVGPGGAVARVSGVVPDRAIHWRHRHRLPGFRSAPSRRRLPAPKSDAPAAVGKHPTAPGAEQFGPPGRSTETSSSTFSSSRRSRVATAPTCATAYTRFSARATEPDKYVSVVGYDRGTRASTTSTA